VSNVDIVNIAHLQEHEYLRHCVGRIATLQPDIVLVEKTVSRLAQGFLLDAGITLVINVKPVCNSSFLAWKLYFCKLF
jgi:hypothetical protein